MKAAAVICLCLAAGVAVVHARSLSQVQVCDNSITKPGQVSSSGIAMKETKNEGSYSFITVEWPHPRDRKTSGGLDSCISEYQVEVYRASDNKKITQGTTGSVSPAHTSATYTAKGLLPGEKYAFAVTPKGSTGAMGSQGYKGQAFTAAPKTATAVPL